MAYVALLRILAVSLVVGGVVLSPLILNPRGDGFEHIRLAFLLALVFGQIVTVPLGFLFGLVLTAKRSWTRPPGYVLAAITIAFGLVVTTQAWSTMAWVDGRPSGIGDPDGEAVLAMLAFLSGAFTTCVGLAVLLVRWFGEAMPEASARSSRRRRRRRGR